MANKTNPHLDLAYTMIQQRTEALAPALPQTYCDKQTENQLYDAGLAYLYAANEQVRAMHAARKPDFWQARAHWPWEHDDGDTIRIQAGPVQNLAQAGAFFSAEADRVVRAKAGARAHQAVCERVAQVAGMIAEHLANPGVPPRRRLAQAERPWPLIVAIALFIGAIAFQVIRSVFFNHP